GAGGLLECGEFGESGRRVRVWNGREHLLRQMVAGLESGSDVGAKCRGPARVIEDTRLRGERYIGVDQRGAAEPAAAEHVDVVVEAKVVEPGTRAEKGLRGVDLHVVQHFRQRVRIFSRLKFHAALEHANLLAGAREAAGCDGAAIAGTDDHGCVVGLEVLDGGSETRHGVLLSTGGESANLGRERDRAVWAIEKRGKPHSRLSHGSSGTSQRTSAPWGDLTLANGNAAVKRILGAGGAAPPRGSRSVSAEAELLLRRRAC